MAKDTFEELPIFPGGKEKTVFSCKNDCYMMRITETQKQEYDSYIEMLISVGFKEYTTHTIKDNYFTSLFGEEHQIHTYFTMCDGITRIIVDSNRTVFKREKEIIIDKICDTRLYQMELDYRTINCGMCYITQCVDGSFFIVDSAHMNSVNDHVRIYELLKKLTPEGEKIVIAGWFFTHAHQDHIVKFMDFLEADFENYEIECLYYNYPELTVEGSQYWTESDKQTMREFDELIDSHKEIPVVKLHTGNHFFVRNLEFEVLSTHEDIYPKSLECFNDSSTVLLMTVDGCKVMFLGDANTTECETLIERYGAYVKSDLVQVAHHGYNGENVDIYNYINAPVALYANRHTEFEEVKSLPSNRLVLAMSKESYLAEDGTAVFELPYKLGMANVMPREIY